MELNPRVFTHVNAVIQHHGYFPNELLPDVGRPMKMIDFGAFMANTRTHKRNNKRR